MSSAKLDEKQQMRRDYEQLQREFKNMEAMRKAYSEESLAIIKRQREQIEKLQHSTEQLQAELDLETRFAQKRSTNTATLDVLNNQIDLYTQKVENEKKHADQLKKQTSIMKQKILKKRRQMGGVNKAKEDQHIIQKQIRILENRLDKALVKFNEALAYNKEQRKQIDNLRRERFMFDKIYKKLDRELHEKKKQMATIIELSNQAYEARDGAQLEIAAIQQQMAKERGEFEEQMAELARIIEDKDRDEAEEDDKRGNMTMDEEAELQQELNKGAWNIAKNRAAMQVSIDKVQSYEVAFKKINAATGIEDVEELVTTFIHNEDQNFSLFNYVSEQNNELERLEEQIAALQSEKAKYTQESGEDMNQHKQLLKELDSKLARTDSSAATYETKFQVAQRTINSLKSGIQSLFTKIGCNASVMSEMLADSQVTENNMMQYLGMIEQRTNEILQQFAPVSEPVPYAEEEDLTASGAKLATMLGHGPTTEHGTMVLDVEPPKLDDYSTDEDESEDEGEARPLSLRELKDRTLKVIEARAARTGSKFDRSRKAR